MKRLKAAKITIGRVALFCSLMFSFYACSESEAQLDFEDEALQPPSGIMEIDASRNIVEGGEIDTTDWNIAPDFLSRIKIDEDLLPFPNPVAYNSSFQIDINILGIDAINGLSIYAFQQPNELASTNPLRFRKGMLQPGLQSFVISPQEFAPGQGTGTIGNTWRIILFDGQQKIISYGDVLVK